MTQLDTITVAIDADTSAFRREVNEATGLANGFGRAMTRAFEGAIVRGRDFGDVMRGLALRLSNLAVNAALRPVEQGFGALLQNLLAAGAPKLGAPLNILPPGVRGFAKGGVIATPSYFPAGASIGLAGERGAEAILPLARGADGRLGVRAGGEARPMAVTVHISTPDAASFRRSESYVSAAIARAVARGERSL
jgi:phage-related minor tail protein